MALELVDGGVATCRTPGCHRTAYRRGVCGTCYRAQINPRLVDVELPRRRARADSEEEPDELEWHESTVDALRCLADLDRLLLAIERHNLTLQPRSPAPPTLVEMYHRAGGGAFYGRRPSGGALHSACLDLQEQYVRQPMMRAPTNMTRTATLPG